MSHYILPRMLQRSNVFLLKKRCKDIWIFFSPHQTSRDVPSTVVDVILCYILEALSMLETVYFTHAFISSVTRIRYSYQYQIAMRSTKRCRTGEIFWNYKFCVLDQQPGTFSCPQFTITFLWNSSAYHTPTWFMCKRNTLFILFYLSSVSLNILFILLLLLLIFIIFDYLSYLKY
jgi:hypothetical protein